MLLCCLRRNVDWLLVINTSSSSPVKNKRRRLTATNVNNLPRFVASEYNALSSRAVHSTWWRYWLKISYPTCIRRRPSGGPRRNIAITFGMELHCGAKKLHPFIFAITLSHHIIFWWFLAHRYWSKFATKLQQNSSPLMMAVLTLSCEKKHEAICS